MDYEMMRHINDMAVKKQAESIKPKPVKKKNKWIHNVIEWTYTALIAAVILYAMLAITAYCLS